MIVLIIGCKGFIGSHASTYFSAKGDTIIGYDMVEADGTEPYPYYQRKSTGAALEAIISKYRPDACINAGGNGSVPFSIANPVSDFESNVSFHTELLDIIHQYDPACKYIHLSSAAVYGNPRQLPVTENSPVLPISPYGWHKHQAELICREYAVLYNLQTASLRVFSVYGPGLRKQLFWDTYQKSRKNNTIQLFGTGDESRDFIYITDLVAAIDSVLTNAVMQGEVINVSSGIETTIAEAVSLFTGFMENHNVVFNHQDNPGNPLNWKADIKQLKNLGFTAKVSLQEGLNITVKWLKENA